MIENIQKLAEHSGSTQTTVQRLAALPPLEYETVRENEAKQLNVRVKVLDDAVVAARRVSHKGEDASSMFNDVTPFAEPVDAAILLDEIFEVIRRFIICPEETAIAATLWTTMTWFIKNIQVAPLAIITAPEKRCGKSQFLDLIGRLSYRPLVASNISPAAIFRTIEAYGPTLLIDEADTFLKDNEEARGVLNSGHTRQGAFIVRLVGDNHETKRFSTWGAKAISGIGTLADTLMDRGIILELRRKLPLEKVERLRHAEKALFVTLTAKLARFALDAGNHIENARPALPQELHDRAQDNWEPLLAIADYAGGEWAIRARSAALRLSAGDNEAVSLSSELLMDIRDIFTTSRKTADRFSTADLLQELNADDLKPWQTFNRGKPMTPRQLAKRLGEYGIKSETIRIGHSTPKGYMRKWFDDVFERYLPLPPDKSATGQPCGEIAGSSTGSAVADISQRCGDDTIRTTDKPLKREEDVYVAAEKVEIPWYEQAEITV
ncbi:MAG TPA: DUF3631 domain-containing protein [Patescibacteria group bacterium]|nr:DUF3631 domain-containing protein [Patescibacteria group bacterium]